MAWRGVWCVECGLWRATWGVRPVACGLSRAACPWPVDKACFKGTRTRHSRCPPQQPHPHKNQMHLQDGPIPKMP